MDSLLREFGSWYWSCDFVDPQLRDAYEMLSTAQTLAEWDGAYLKLLRSDDTMAQGVAMDFFDRANALGRFGEDNPCAPHQEELGRVARELLRQPPRPEDDDAHEGANHASAVQLLRHDPAPGDAALIKTMLDHAPGEATLRDVLAAAESVLAVAADSQLVDAVRGIVVDPQRGGETRAKAFEAIGDLLDDDSADFVASLTSQPGVGVLASYWLVERAGPFRYRQLLRRWLDVWQDEYPGGWIEIIRGAVAVGPHSTHWTGFEAETAELRRAHRRLREPDGVEAHREAFETLLRSGRTVAVGIALDHFVLRDGGGLTRYGTKPDPYIPVVRRAATDLLRHPAGHEDAEYLSALDVLAMHAEPGDATLLAQVLRAEGTGYRVRESALKTVCSDLRRFDTVDEALFTALAELIFDETVDLGLRADAVHALFNADSPHATAILVRATESPSLFLQIAGAAGLVRKHRVDDHGQRLAELAAVWPANLGTVLSTFGGWADLVRAHGRP